MKTKNRNKKLLDKGFHKHYCDRRNRLKYDRAYVKNRMSDIPFLSFTMTSHEHRWHDDWHNESKRTKYVSKFIEKNIGRPADDVYSELSREFGFADPVTRREAWEWAVETNPNRLYDGDLYVNDEGNLDYYRNPNQYRRYKRNNTKVYVPDFVLKHNTGQSIPDFGPVRTQPEDKGSCWPWTNSCGNLTQIGTCMKKLPGKWYVKYKTEWLLLSVYVFPTKQTPKTKYSHVNRDQKLIETKNEFDNVFQSCTVFTKDGYLRHDHYEKYHCRLFNRETSMYETAHEIGNLGYGVLRTYISIAEAEKELWKVLAIKD